MHRRPLVMLAVGVAGGLLSGFFGVGGGIVLVPLLVLVGIGQHQAHATSLAAILVIALSAAATFAAGGAVHWPMGLTLGVGAVAGSMVGAALMHRLSPRTLRGGFSVLLVVAGLWMILG